MALPNVKILIQNGALGGLLSFAEGVTGFIATGAAVTSKIQIGDPRQVFNLADAEAIGITLADNPTMYRLVKEFYSEGSGKELFVMIVADTMDQHTMVDKTNANGAVKLLNFANGRIRLLGTAFLPPGGYSLVTTNGLDADVFTAITNGQALAKEYADNNMPVRIILEGRAYTGTASALTDLLTMSNDRVGVVVGSQTSGASAAVGYFLGRTAANPVQRKASRVKDGALPINTAFVGTQNVDTYSGLGAMHDKGYIVFRKFASLSGYFFSSDHMAAGPTNDFSLLARGRVIDKAAVLAYGTYVEEIEEEIVIGADGKLDGGFITFMQEKIENQINLSMTANREISGVRCIIDPAQNVLSLNKTKIKLRITPVGYNTDIEVDLGFENPAL